MTSRKAKVKRQRVKERKGMEIRKERKVIARVKVKAKTRKQRCGDALHGKPAHLAKDCWRKNI